MTLVSHRIVPAAALACAALLAAGGCNRARVEAPPAVRLIETVPVETSLGNPDLEPAHEAWLGLIRGARRSLDFEQFYVSRWPGEPLDDVLDAIGDAAARGVRVRFIVDGRMHDTYPRTIDSLGTVHGIETRIIRMRDIGGGVQHAKFFIVDGETVVLGSQNFDWRALKHIHELGVVIRDARVAGAFAGVFEMDWNASDLDSARAAASVAAARDAARRAAPGPVPYRVARAQGDTVDVWPSWSPHGWIPDSTRWDRDAIVRVLDGARGEVVLQLLKYGPGSRGRGDATLDQALRRAAARGVRVKMILSDWQADGEEMTAYQDLARVPGIEARLSTIPEWSGGYIPFARVDHCKYAVADTTVLWIGTSNWEPGYWWDSRNVAVTLRHRGLARDARRVFEASWNAAGTAPVHPDSTYAPKIHGEEPPHGAVKYGG
jgi:phosphatidylserine/phosphatidylglycerophosphate/cardiolipin synthase-like enzyme